MPGRISATIVLATTLSMACSGGITHTDIVPALPRSGDAHTAKPPSMPAPAEPADPWAGREDLIVAPPAKAPTALELPPIERFSLSNGLQVIVVREDRLPTVRMQLAIKAGRRDATRDKVGVAEFAASMLTMGTRTQSALALAERIDQVGGTLGANAGLETTVIDCSALVEHLRTCVTMVADITVNPTFPKAEMEIVRGQLQGLVQRRKDDAGALANSHLENLLWGEEHVRGWPLSLRTIANIERADLQAWHRSWFAPNNAVLVIAGKVDPKTVRTELTRSQLRWWQKRKLPKRAAYAEPTLGGARIRVVDKPGQTQTQIRIAQMGIRHDAPDYFDHQVFNYVLGGGAFSSRLMRVVRSKAGQTYSVSSVFERHQERGAFLISTFTRNESTFSTLGLILDELVTMKQGGPSAEEVAGAISYLAGSYVTRFQTAADIGDAILGAELHGLGEAYVRDYPLSVAKVTKDSAARAAAKTLDPQKLAIVLVGDAKDIVPQLDAAGWNYERVSYQSPVASYERAELARASQDPKAQKRGRQLIEQALAAKGGADRLRAIKTMTVRAKGEVAVQGRTLAASFARHFVAPDRLRMDIELDIGGAKAQVITVLDRDKAWNQQPGQAPLMLPDEAVIEFRKQLWRDHEQVLLHALDEGALLEALGPASVEGETFDAVRVTRANPDTAVILYLDQKTHLLRRLVYTEQGVQGTESFADYRSIKGIQVAHQRQTDSPDASMKVQVTSVTFDTPIDDAIFAFPK